MDAPGADAGPLDVVSIGELVVDFISVEQTDTLGNATTFRRYLGGSPANITVYVSKLGGTAATISKTGIGAFGKFLKSQLGRHGIITGYLIMDHSTNITIVFVSSTSGTPDFEEFRGGDYLLAPGEVSGETIGRARGARSSPSTRTTADASGLTTRRQERSSGRFTGTWTSPSPPSMTQAASSAASTSPRST